VPFYPWSEPTLNSSYSFQCRPIVRSLIEKYQLVWEVQYAEKRKIARVTLIMCSFHTLVDKRYYSHLPQFSACPVKDRPTAICIHHLLGQTQAAPVTDPSAGKLTTREKRLICATQKEFVVASQAFPYLHVIPSRGNEHHVLSGKCLFLIKNHRILCNIGLT
jgi:hypothetical protein